MFNKLINKKIEAYQKELIETHYNEVENMYKKVRMFRHDYKNHIQTMKILLSNNKLIELENYLNDLSNELNTVDTVIKTGNAMADSIINSKISLANSKNIKVVIDANIPVKLKMKELDLCCILGNLFDNAIEASKDLKEEDRLIRVYMDMKNTQLYISFTNITGKSKQKKINNIFKTSKGEGHGFGLVRIDNIIDKYDGYISRNSEDYAFTTEILIPQE